MEDRRNDYIYGQQGINPYPRQQVMGRGFPGQTQPVPYRPFSQQNDTASLVPPDTQVLTQNGFKPLTKEERAEAARIAEEAGFSFEGYQVVRREFFSHKFDPTLTIRGNSIIFNNACISKMDSVVYVQVLVNPTTEKLVIRPCEEGARDSIRWCIVKDDKRKSRQITCGLFTAKLYEMMGWEQLYRYKLQGTRINYKGQQLYVFDLTSTEVFLPAVKDPDNPTADLRDSSSFDVTTDVLVEDGVQKRYSNLKMLYITYDDDGHYQSVQEVKWFVRNKTLKRTCLTKAGTEDERCPKEGDPDTAYVASGVEKFNIIVPTPAARLANVPVFPPASDGGVFRLVARSGGDIYAPLQITNGSSEGVGGPKQVLSNFFSNYDNDHDAVLDPTNRKINQLFAVRADATSETEWNALCTSLGSITLEPDNEYQLSFFVPYIENKSRMFVPGVDHMSVGFRSIATGEPPQKAGKNLLDDFIFFPPLDVNGKGTRNMRFTVPEQLTDLCIAFTFASYSPLVSQGAVTIENLKLTKVATSNYDFGTPLYTSSNTGIATTDIKEKKNVKALRVELQIGRGGKKDVSGVKQAGETGEVNMTIPIPSNGPRD